MASSNPSSNWRGRGRGGLNRDPPFQQWQLLHSRLSESNARYGPAQDIWSLLNEAMIRSFLTSPSYILVEEDDDGDVIWMHGGEMERSVQDWMVSRSLEMDSGYVTPVDTKAVLKKCQREVYKPKSKGKSFGTEQEDCPICLEKFIAKQTLFSIPSCNHKFHVDCLTPWIKNNHGCCPVCRIDILAGSSRQTSSSSSLTTLSRPTPTPTPTQGRTFSTPTRPQTQENQGVSRYNAPSNSSIRVITTPATNQQVISNTGRNEPDDLMLVWAAMEVALDRMNLHS